MKTLKNQLKSRKCSRCGASFDSVRPFRLCWSCRVGARGANNRG